MKRIMKPYKGSTDSPFTTADIRTYPVYIQPKYDGIRCVVLHGVATSASLKPLPNCYLQEWAKHMPSGIDGEVICETFHEAESFCMSKYKPVPNSARFVAFDAVMPAEFHNRWGYVRTWWHDSKRPPILACNLSPTSLITSQGEADDAVHRLLESGHEGVIIRRASGMYKEGRSTPRTQELCAIKPLMDLECIIADYYPLQVNLNTPYIDEQGLQKRSHAQAGKQAIETLGGFVLLHSRWPKPFKCGTGFTAEQRLDFWRRRDTLKGALATIKSQLFGSKDAPRIPVFKSLRNTIDLSS